MTLDAGSTGKPTASCQRNEDSELLLHATNEDSSTSKRASSSNSSSANSSIHLPAQTTLLHYYENWGH